MKGNLKYFIAQQPGAVGVIARHYPMPKAVGGAASSATASAQHPERTKVREECEHCPLPKWQVSQA
ncbi:hypothetical protein A6J33_005430 [Pantoea sp. FDAARGOS_194]|nr:hypothetical protein A6J33_005430 [Pantoea sp. FDAARGOS_194]